MNRERPSPPKELVAVLFCTCFRRHWDGDCFLRFLSHSWSPITVHRFQYYKTCQVCQAQWCKPLIAVLERHRQADFCEFEASQSYQVRSYLKTNKQANKHTNTPKPCQADPKVTTERTSFTYATRVCDPNLIAQTTS